jgi:thioredoxin reductase/NAD-dependent dihydropyrimidine dehydrogenase PreA subunit
VLGFVKRYTHWLHTRWPAGTVEKRPEVDADGRTNVPGLFVTGDLTGVPLLKFSLESGARVIETIAGELKGGGAGNGGVDVAIVGAGVSGMAAAMEAKRRGLSYRVLESAEPFFTVVNFPRAKPIYTYPRSMTPRGTLQVRAEVKEDLLDELRAQAAAAGIEVESGRVDVVRRTGDGFTLEVDEGKPVTARRVVVAIGQNGDFRRLDVPGEDRDRVYNRLHDPKDFCGQDALVVGGGDSAAETAIALARCGARVTLSYRGRELSRPKPENVDMVMDLARGHGEGAHVEAPTGRTTAAVDDFMPGAAGKGSLALEPGSTVREIGDDAVVLRTGDGDKTLPNDVVFAMIGREAPLDFFRRSGVRIAGEMNARNWAALGAFVLFCIWLYNWKSGGFFDKLWGRLHWFPYNLPDLLGNAAADPASLLGIIVKSAAGPAFWYTLAYSLVVVVFGVRRIRRRRTPYITVQTATLMAVQVVPLFLLPEIILPWLNYHGLLPSGPADALFPEATYGHGREFWRAYGLILAWPLNVYNVFTHDPLPAWLWICGIQTLVLIPLGIYFFGKGAYCGWICSCGALAETLGDTFRHKMPHGPRWNRLNMLGQGILAVAVVLLVLRIASWVAPESSGLKGFLAAAQDGAGKGGVFRLLNYKWTVDVLLAGVLGYGLYFWFSGRMWCRFACPLAALMHVYARFSRFRIFADKKKCISCNVCTSVCHQGIDVMNFANKGLPMNDPECVRCSACVQSCPTGVLTFGRADGKGKVAATDGLAASPVRMREGEG